MASDEFSFRSKTEAVQRYILAKLQSGEIQPGQRLQQDLLAAELGVSSTPVREALRRLEAEGLVVYAAHKGVRARDAARPEVQEAYPIRILLEGYATRLAATRLTEDDLELLKSLHRTMIDLKDAGDLQACAAVNNRWHVTILRAAGSQLLEKTIRGIWAACPWDALISIPGRSATSIAEHERVLLALLDRNPDDAEKAMADHIRSGQQEVRDYGSTSRDTSFTDR